MAVISTDHADKSLCTEDIASATAKTPRPISAEEVKQHSGEYGSFWCVVDGFVVDASDFLGGKKHPGGLKKLLATDVAASGHTGQPYGFSFSRGRNAHFPDTGKLFRQGVEKYLRGNAAPGEEQQYLSESEVVFPKHGKIVILGRLTS